MADRVVTITGTVDSVRFVSRFDGGTTTACVGGSLLAAAFVCVVYVQSQLLSRTPPRVTPPASLVCPHPTIIFRPSRRCRLAVQVLRAVALITTRLSEEPAYPKTIVRPFTYSNLTGGMPALAYGAPASAPPPKRARRALWIRFMSRTSSHCVQQRRALDDTALLPAGASPGLSLVSPGMLGLPQAIGSPLTVGTPQRQPMAAQPQCPSAHSPTDCCPTSFHLHSRPLSPAVTFAQNRRSQQRLCPSHSGR